MEIQEVENKHHLTSQKIKAFENSTADIKKEELLFQDELDKLFLDYKDSLKEHKKDTTPDVFWKVFRLLAQIYYKMYTAYSS